jgi:ribosome-associated protein
MNSKPSHTPSDRPPEPNEVPLVGGEPDEDARSRSSLKRERVNNETALYDLVVELLPLSEARWIAFGVPQIAIDKLLDARKIKSHSARDRHLRLIRSTLRDFDWSLIRRKLDRLKAGLPIGEDVVPAANVVTWTEQLLVQGDAGLARFAEEYPSADRKRLRTLVRNVTGAPDMKRGKTRQALERAVQNEINRAEKEQAEQLDPAEPVESEEP